MAKESRFQLHYHVRNGGDGSASVEFHASKKDAESAEEQDIENYGEGWGEPSASSVDLKVLDGQLFYRDDYYDEEAGRFTERWCPVEKD